MSVFRKSLIILLLSLFSHSLAQLDCNKCGDFNVKCVGPTQYQYCRQDTGEGVGDVIKCPSNQICSTLVSPSEPCVDKTEYLIPDCICGYCANDFFACVSDKQFKVCLDDSFPPKGPMISCPPGKQCDPYLLSGSYCSTSGKSYCPENVLPPPDPSTSTTSATIKTTMVPTTSSSMNTDCKSEGKFPTPNSRCKQYYTCILVNEQWFKIENSCTGTANFNPSTQRCSLSYNCPDN